VTDPNGESAFQTQSQIAATLAALGRGPLHRFGQNFLIDRNLMHKLLDAAEPSPSDVALEVGPGTGSLTGLLLGRFAHVISVEIDTDLAEVVAGRFASVDTFTLVRGDCLHNKSTLSPDMMAAIRVALHRHPGGALHLVANLPYDAATPLVVDLLLSDLPLRRLCFTVQTEVADRFLAAPSSRDYGPVGIITQALADGRRIAKCPPQAFWPRPKVHSTMVRLDVRPERPATLNPANQFAWFVRSMFLHRRKTLANNAKTLPDADQVMNAVMQCGIDPGQRPENLTVSQWIQIHELAQSQRFATLSDANSPSTLGPLKKWYYRDNCPCCGLEGEMAITKSPNGAFSFRCLECYMAFDRPEDVGFIERSYHGLNTPMLAPTLDEIIAHGWGEYCAWETMDYERTADYDGII